MSETIRVEGLPELEAKLVDLGAKVRPALLGTTRSGARLLVSAIRSEAPVGKYTAKEAAQRAKQADIAGNLQRSVKLKASRTKTSAFVGHVVGPFGKGSAHRHLVIGGHDIRGQYAHHVGAFTVGVNVGSKRKPKVLQTTAYRLRFGGHAATGGRTTPNAFVARGRMRAESAALAATEREAKVQIEKAAAM